MSDDLMPGGFFDGEDIEDISNDPFRIEDGTYTFRITKVTVKMTEPSLEAQAEGKFPKLGFQPSLSCVDNDFPQYKGIPVNGRWTRVPRKADPDFKDRLSSTDENEQATALAEFRRIQSSLRQQFEAFGVPADKLKTLDPQELVGMEVRCRVVNETREYEGEMVTNRVVKAYYPVLEVNDIDIATTGAMGAENDW